MQQGREVVERVVAWSIVLLVHLLVGAWLVRWHVATGPTVVDDALNVQFVVRRPVVRQTSAANPVERVKAVTGARAVGTDSMRRRRLMSDGGPPKGEPQTAVAEVPTSLDLRVPELALETGRRDPLERAPAIEVRPTRFARAWVPAGNALEQAGFRSKAVGVALSAFGGPPRRCSEIERRLRKPGCLPLHGQELEDEVLRARADH